MMRRGLGSIALAVLASCQRDRSMFTTASERAYDIAVLGAFTLLGFTVVGAILWVILLWVARRRRGSFDEHAPVSRDDGKGWVLVGGILIPGAVFLTLLIVSLVQLDTASEDHHVHGRPTIRVTGHRWWWQVEYLGDSPHQVVASANEIHIPVGQPVDLELVAADVIHSFWVPSLGGKVDLIPGHKNGIRLHAEVPGTFLGQCAEFCGVQHANMKLVVIAHPPDDYRRWLANERAPAAPPKTADQIRGKLAFEAGPCVICHQIRGTRARGTIGPDLTHVGSRGWIGTNMFPVNRAFLGGWVTRAHSLKPGIRMPDLTAFTGAELDALTSYLAGLR